MKSKFWHERWKQKDIGFHLEKENPLLVKHLKSLNKAPGSRLFIPLCGKTKDITWLLGQGYLVVGIELSEIAVKELFQELNMVPSISSFGKIKRYQAKNIDIYIGNFFDLSRNDLGDIDAIYDRGALVALPTEMRERYAAHLNKIGLAAPQLLITYNYNQDLMAGPPFSISTEELTHLYANNHQLNILEKQKVKGLLKDQCAAEELVWLLD